jgi:hypothetical protein
LGKGCFPQNGNGLLPPINLALSGIGIFVLGLTSFTTTNMKIVMMLATSTLVTFTYQAIMKYAITFITKKIKERVEKQA